MSIIVNSASESTKHFHKVCTFLNKLIGIDFGKRIDRIPKHCNMKANILALKQGRLHWLPRMTRRKYREHFANFETYYFTGSEYGPSTLVMVDIDCHKFGTLEGAKAFAQWMAKHIFKGMYFEVSTNGSGIHGYIILDRPIMTTSSTVLISDTSDVQPQSVNALLKRIESYLKQYVAIFDVSGIEIKGHLVETSYEGRRVTGVTCGSLGKLPRQIIERFEEFKATTRINMGWVGPVIPSPLPKAVLTIVKERKAVVGSFSGKHVKSIKPLMPLARNIMAIAGELAPGKNAIELPCGLDLTAEDIAADLACLFFETSDLNEDGSMPVARHRALREALYEAGDCERQFDAKRFAASRNLMEKAGLLKWTSNEYYFHKDGSGNSTAKGQACRWRLTDAILATIQAFYDLESSDTQSPSADEKIRASLIGATIQVKASDHTIRPEFVMPIPYRVPDVSDFGEYLAKAA